MTRLALIVAMSRNRVIGRDNDLPWHLPEDLRHFRQLTMGKPLVMGRRTWQSIGRPLPGRPSLVVSREPTFAAEGADVFTSLDAALERAGVLAARAGVDEVMVIGGAQIYAEALPRVARLYVTEVHAEVPGDTWFPAFEGPAWQETMREEHPPAEGRPGFAFVQHDRCQGSDIG